MSALWTTGRHGNGDACRPRGLIAPGRVRYLNRQPHAGKGDAFFAIQGENRDGHEFVESALKAGAGFAVVMSGQEKSLPGAPLVIVHDVLDALRDLARAARARARARVVAVTGSVGKTGTKDALRLALSAEGETHASASLTTIIGACRYRLRGARRAQGTPCSRSG